MTWSLSAIWPCMLRQQHGWRLLFASLKIRAAHAIPPVTGNTGPCLGELAQQRVIYAPSWNPASTYNGFRVCFHMKDSSVDAIGLTDSRVYTEAAIDSCRRRRPKKDAVLTVRKPTIEGNTRNVVPSSRVEIGQYGDHTLKSMRP